MHSNHGLLFTQTSHYLLVPLSLLKGWQSCILSLEWSVPCTQACVSAWNGVSMPSNKTVQVLRDGLENTEEATNCLLVQEKCYPCWLWNFLMLEYASYVAQLVRHFVLALAGDSKMHCTTLVKATARSHSHHCFPNPGHFTIARGPSKPSVVSAYRECLMDCPELLHLWLWLVMCSYFYLEDVNICLFNNQCMQIGKNTQVPSPGQHSWSV